MSGSRGPLSKDPSQLRRRNLPSGAKVQLPMEGWQGDIPQWPLLEGTDIEIYRWEQLWRTAQAAAWVRMHIDFTIARYVRLSILVETEAKNNVATAQVINSVMALEKELGLTPAALKRLEWEVVADEVEDARETKPAPRGRRLKAVDMDGA